jgi:transposase
VIVAGAVDPRRLVFVDEMGTNTSLSALYAYAPKRRSAYARIPRNRGANTTLLASMSLEGMGPCLAVEGATTAPVFETYVEKVLAPSLRRGQIIVLDNLSAHKSERAKELIEERGCQILYLPVYSSPDFNPIEEAFSKIKGALRKAQARTREALIEALGVAISAVTTRDAHCFFEHGGYHLPVHLL